MKERVNQLFKDKLTLVMLVLGLLTIVAAAGVVSIQNGRQKEQNPYLSMETEPVGPAENTKEEQMQVAGSSNGAEATQGLQTAKTEETKAQKTESRDPSANQETQAVAVNDANAAQEAEAVGVGQESAYSLVLNFGEQQSLLWPVQGNVVLDYSMDSTIFFPTLEQFKCNPGLVIQGEVSQPVAAPANARVLETGSNEEIGNYLVMDLGDEFNLICGQLKEVQVVEGEYLEKGQIVGYVAEPTKYYTIEGPNVYMQLKKNDKSLDPLDYLE